MTPPRRHAMRLVESVYRQPGQTFSVTIGTEPRSPVFADIGLGLECVNLLRRICDAGARGYAYCLMPDHVHLLIGVGNHQCLSAIIGGWKSLCYRARRRRGCDR